MPNLLRATWTQLDSLELKLLLVERIGGPGQFADSDDRNKLCLPLGGAVCRLVLTFRSKEVVEVAPGPAFDGAEWRHIEAEIEESLLVGARKVGRDFSFSSHRVFGSWRGERSGVQILPPPEEAPHAPFEMAEHPFVLEFPLQTTSMWPLTNHRRRREHRRLTLLLNVLLAGRTSLQPLRADHFWAGIPREDGRVDIRYVQQFFMADLGAVVIDSLSGPAGLRLEEIASNEYYARVGHDGLGLRVPSDLDLSILQYRGLSRQRRAQFDRCAFWMDMASREWTVSVSSSFASLVSAVEALTDRGETHRVPCEQCGTISQHEVPGATERFRTFFETYAPGGGLRSRRNEMYSLRSGILHGSELMQLDQDLSFGWDPPGWNERELHDDLWRLTRIATRNWLSQTSEAGT